MLCAIASSSHHVNCYKGRTQSRLVLNGSKLETISCSRALQRCERAKLGDKSYNMKPTPVFINYADPSEQNDKRNRRKVASYIGTHYRNRSRPSAKRDSNLNSGSSNTQDQQLVKRKPDNVITRPKQITWRIGQHTASPLSVHDMHGFRSDPFDSYPIPATEKIPKAIEYCTLSAFTT